MSNRQFVLGGAESAYVTPSASVIDCQNEGLLCVSAPGATIDPGTEDNWGELN